MNYLYNESKKSIGYKGETAVLLRLKTCGFEVYKRNLKKIDFETDIIVYKYNKIKHSLDIRVVEVKTRNYYEFDLSSFGIDKKWRLIRRHIFKIKEDIDSKFDILNFSEIHFDLALVRYVENNYILYKYIKNVNLII